MMEQYFSKEVKICFDNGFWATEKMLVHELSDGVVGV